ncbi:MAG: reverse transcriptase family protein [Bryobacterales bacterium]|nr:reverse transcriptase family protein [Bryobacterales bacterium]
MSRIEPLTTKYGMSQSPLFRLGSRRTAEFLHWCGTANDLDRFAERDDNYRVFTVCEVGKKPRLVQEPKEGLKRLYGRLANLLLRMDPPSYLHSGLKGRSFVTNGMQHVNDMPAIKLDVRRFYPSTGWGHVFRFFYHEMECARDVSGLIARISCFTDKNESFLPTGSCLSQILAFYCHKRMFDEIDAFVRARGGILTVYVDDIVASMPDASPADIRRIGRIVTKQGLSWHKDRFFPKGVPKRVTGTIAKTEHLEADKRQHFNYFAALETMSGADIAPKEKGKAARRALGILQSIAQVDNRCVVMASGMAKKLIPITRQV